MAILCLGRREKLAKAMIVAVEAELKRSGVPTSTNEAQSIAKEVITLAVAFAIGKEYEAKEKGHIEAGGEKEGYTEMISHLLSEAANLNKGLNSVLKKERLDRRDEAWSGAIANPF